ncbi:ABC transporter permease [Desulfotomaculum copahuensis]|nr:ABC transporter permease [Desulfotomaculum copahuensis]
MLTRKMWRDIGENKMAFIACAVVVIIGLTAYTSMQMAKDNLFRAGDSFYRQYHFGDGFAKIKNPMPSSQVEKLSDIRGIDQVQGRLVEDVRVTGLDERRNIYLRLISLQDQKPYILNGVKVLKGAMPEENSKALLLGDKFFTAHRLALGEPLTVIIDGKKVQLKIAGTGQSPDFVYAIRNAQNILPDPQAFDVAYLPYEVMDGLFNRQGAVNDLSFALKPGFKFEDVEQPLKTELKKYGLESLVSRADQASNVMLTEELKGLEKSARSVPVLFLAIAAIILYIMLKRMVESQRGQIGTLKAYGYRNHEIIWHYLSYGLIVGLAGGILGGVSGAVLSNSMTKLYQQYFSLPGLTGKFPLQYFFSGILFALGFSLIASYQGAKAILKLKPVDAMRPPAPSFKSKTRLEKLPVVWAAFTVQGRMAVRNMIRNKERSFFTLIGIVFTYSMMAALWSMYSMVDTMVLDQFYKVQKSDVKISFTKPLPLPDVVEELQNTGGVRRIEPLVEVPVTLQKDYRKKDVTALGLLPDAELFTPVDKLGSQIKIPAGGILLSEQTARKLKTGLGDRIRLESIWARESPVYVQVAGIVPQYIGSNVYMDQKALLALLGQGDMATGALISMDPGQIPGLKERYGTSKYVDNLEERQQSIDLYKKLMDNNKTTLLLMVLMAVVAGFAIVYNSSIITLAERERELASLRVLGMRPKEVMEVVSVEQWFIGAFGVLAGVPFALAMNQGIAGGMSSDLYTLPGRTSPAALFLALLGTVLAIWVAQFWVFRKIARLDLVGVLKERE